MNNSVDIENYQKLITLMEQALMFYGNEQNYLNEKKGNKPLIVLDAYGSQARYALDQIKKLKEIYSELNKDFENFELNDEILNIIKNTNNLI